MLSRTHTGTFSACGARPLLDEAYRTTPLGDGLGCHPPTLFLPRRTAADHHLPKVPLKNGLSDDLHTALTATNVFYQGWGLMPAMLQYLISVSSDAVV